MPRQRLNFGASGDNFAIPAVAGRPIAVYGMHISFDSPVTMTVKDGASTVLDGYRNITSVVLDFAANRAYYTTSTGNAFVINLSSAVQADGLVDYETLSFSLLARVMAAPRRLVRRFLPSRPRRTIS